MTKIIDTMCDPGVEMSNLPTTQEINAVMDQVKALMLELDRGQLEALCKRAKRRNLDIEVKRGKNMIDTAVQIRLSKIYKDLGAAL